MWVLLDEPKPGGQIDTAGRCERVVGPERHAFIAGSTSEIDAVLDEATSETEAPGLRIDEQDPKLGGVVFFSHAEHAPDPLTVALGDPCRLRLALV
jgi:hypothetical protein